MAKSKITVYDIAREAGVSAATVSRVLTGNVPVHEKTKEKVVHVLQKYDFRPSSVARSLKARRSKSIGFVVPDITNHNFSTMFLALEQRVAQSVFTSYATPAPTTRARARFSKCYWRRRSRRSSSPAGASMQWVCRRNMSPRLSESTAWYR